MWGCEGVLRGWWGKKTGIELFVSLFWAPLPLLQMSMCSPPSPICWGCRWPTEESTYHSLPGHLTICLPIYSSAHLMTIHPVHSAVLLPPSSIFQIISPSTHPSVHPSSNSSPHLFIPPSFIHLSIFYPSIHPHTPARFHQLPAAPSRLHFSCFECSHEYNRQGVWLPNRTQDGFSINRWILKLLLWLNNSGTMQNTGEGETIKNTDGETCSDTVARRLQRHSELQAHRYIL